MAARHQDVLLAHMRSFRLRLSPEKSVHSTSRRTAFLGVIWDWVWFLDLISVLD